MSATALPQSIKQVTIHTGNILSLNGIISKPSQNASEELVESIKIAFNDEASNLANDYESVVEIMRKNDDLQQKMSSLDRKDLKIGAKLFLNNENASAVNQAVLNIFRALKIETIDNLIVSYNDFEKKIEESDSSVSVNQNVLSKVKAIWPILEKFTNEDEPNRILHLGVADLDEEQFRELYKCSKVKPDIIQINLASCCVVPPTLQEFCNQNNIQLLTHSDPTEILPKTSIRDLFGDKNTLKLFWAIRFQIHIKCRGVLTSKGYIVNLCDKIIEE